MGIDTRIRMYTRKKIKNKLQFYSSHHSGWLDYANIMVQRCNNNNRCGLHHRPCWIYIERITAYSVRYGDFNRIACRYNYTKTLFYSCTNTHGEGGFNGKAMFIRDALRCSSVFK